MWNHWVVRASTPLEPFEDFETARSFWKNLNQNFPELLSAVLMPNHLHLILPGKENETVNFRLNGLLGPLSRRLKRKNLWQAIPPPANIPDKFHLHRQLRYVALNPCRKGLCKDPLEWYWSSYRELMGAAFEKQNSVARIARALGEPTKNFKVRFHSYVSSDPSVLVTGTPLPKTATPKIFANESIGEILAASAAALRQMPIYVQKKGPLRVLFIHLAYRHGWKQPALLSRICKMTQHSVYEVMKKSPPPEILAADFCLGDRRLRPADPFIGLPLKS